VQAPETIPALVDDAAVRDGTRTWLRDDDGTQTFGGARAVVLETAAALRRAGVHRGDLVVLTPRTTPSWLLGWLAVTALGAVAVPTDPTATEHELGGLLEQVRPRLVVSEEPTLAGVHRALRVAGVTAEVLAVSDVVGDWRRTTAAPAVDLPALSGDDLAVLLPTSGTTGRSKLVMQTHRAYAWAGEGFPWWMKITAADRMMTALPFFHVNALAYSSLGSLACGAELVLLPRFSASGFLDAARRHGATQFNAIGAMLEFLWRQPAREDDDDNPLRLCYTGPSPERAWQEAFEQRFGLRVVCGYGLSESTYGLIWRHGSRPFGTLGSLRQHPRLGEVNRGRVVDDEGRDVPVGGTGELLLRNPTVTPGYWQMPEATGAAVQDGWLHTGDLVEVGEDGTFTFVARRKEVLRRRGMNLSPAEVEEVVGAHPDVVEVAVVGVPADVTEEEVKAFVVLRAGADTDFGELHAWTSQRLSAFKVPRYWQAVESLPRTPTARVAKHRLPTGHPPDEHDAVGQPPERPHVRPDPEKDSP
jgi:carnitine-CoA ligase